MDHLENILPGRTGKTEIQHDAGIGKTHLAIPGHHLVVNGDVFFACRGESAVLPVGRAAGIGSHHPVMISSPGREAGYGDAHGHICGSGYRALFGH
ncbi:hypothetical protein ES703_26547 [subsurface metagenome]